MSEIQDRLQAMLTQMVAEGRERGAQLAVYHKGKLVIDAYAGVADPATGAKVDGRTLFPVFSVTKGIAATIAHRLVERGVLGYDTPIAAVWPEFAAHGKENILFRHALNHTSGLQFMPSGLKPSDVGHWDKICAAMADQTPVSPPGAEVVYHAVTFGWIVGETLRRASGRSFEQLLEDEIRRPLGLKDMYVGLPAEFDSRVAVLDEKFDPPFQASDPTDATPRDIAGYMRPLHAWMNGVDARRACVPASNGIMSARDLAKHYASLLPGGVDGVELLSPARVKIATQITVPTRNPSPAEPKRIGLGYFLGGDPTGGGFGTRPTAFGHAGYGGSFGFADPEQQFAFAYTKNLFSKQGAGTPIVQAAKTALGIPA